MTVFVNDQVVEYFLVVTASVACVTTSGLIASMFFRRHPAIRHSILLVALLSSLASPFVACAFVAAGTSLIEVPLLSSEGTSSRAVAAPRIGRPTQADRDFLAHDSFPSPELSSPESREASPVDNPAARARHPGVTVAQGVLLTWAVGAGCLVLGFVRSLLHLRRLRQSCRPVVEESLQKALLEAAGRLRIEHVPELVVSPEVHAPVVIGPFHPVIVLPEQSLAVMSRVVLCDVLVHEIAHVIRGDHLIVLLETAAKTLFWPIPSVHLLNRLLGIAREDVCDNYVLRDQDAVSYGETLLRLGELAHGVTSFSPSTGFLHWRGRLEHRVSRLLDERTNRMTRLNRLAGFALVILFALATAVLCGTTIVTAQTTSSAREGAETETPPDDVSSSLVSNRPVLSEPPAGPKTDLNAIVELVNAINEEKEEHQQQAKKQKEVVAELNNLGVGVWQYEPNRLGKLNRRLPAPIRDGFRKALGGDMFSSVSRVSIWKPLDEKGLKEVLQWLKSFPQLNQVSVFALRREQIEKVKAALPEVTVEPGMAQLLLESEKTSGIPTAEDQELKVAEAQLAVLDAQEKLEHTLRMFRRGYVSSLALEKAKLEVEKARSHLELEQGSAPESLKLQVAEAQLAVLDAQEKLEQTKRLAKRGYVRQIAVEKAKLGVERAQNLLRGVADAEPSGPPADH